MTRAFSIVELLIAIALLGLVAALALPAGVALLTNEGARSGVFVCESALRSVRDEAMREGVIMELAARETEGAWTLVARPLVTESFDEDPETPAEDEPDWETVSELPGGFSFRFEALPTIAESFDELPEPPAFGPEEEEPARVALLLPSGAVEGVDSWRLVTETDRAPRVERLKIGRWTGGVTAQRETNDDPALAPVEPPADEP